MTITKIYEFEAEWCQPCKTMRKIIEKVAWMLGIDEKTIERIDVDKRPDMVDTFKIRELPTVIFFDEEGWETLRIIGTIPADKILETLLNR